MGMWVPRTLSLSLEKKIKTKHKNETFTLLGYEWTQKSFDVGEVHVYKTIYMRP